MVVVRYKSVLLLHTLILDVIHSCKYLMIVLVYHYEHLYFDVNDISDLL
jgi:hypothetical protein